MVEHNLKTWDEFMVDIARGEKTFEVRKNDRGFKKDDMLVLLGWDNQNNKYTGQQIKVRVTYVLRGGAFGIEKDYCVMGFEILNIKM